MILFSSHCQICQLAYICALLSCSPSFNSGRIVCANLSAKPWIPSPSPARDLRTQHYPHPLLFVSFSFYSSFPSASQSAVFKNTKTEFSLAFPFLPVATPLWEKFLQRPVHTVFSSLYSIFSILFVCAQSRLVLCNPMDCSPPGSSVHGILQARIPEWGAIPFSRGSA